MAKNPQHFFGRLKVGGCEWRGLGGGDDSYNSHVPFSSFHLQTFPPFSTPLIKYFPTLLFCLSNIFLLFPLWDQMFDCLHHQKDFSKIFILLQNISFEKFLVLRHHPERQILFSKIYLRTFLGQFVLVTLHFFLFYLVREGARGAPYDERSPSTVVDQSTGESHLKSLLMCVYFVKNWEQEIRSKCISSALQRQRFFLYKSCLGYSCTVTEEEYWNSFTFDEAARKPEVQKLELHFQSEFHFGSIDCAFLQIDLSNKFTKGKAWLSYKIYLPYWLNQLRAPQSLPPLWL